MLSGENWLVGPQWCISGLLSFPSHSASQALPGDSQLSFSGEKGLNDEKEGGGGRKREVSVQSPTCRNDARWSPKGAERRDTFLIRRDCHFVSPHLKSSSMSRTFANKLLELFSLSSSSFMRFVMRIVLRVMGLPGRFMRNSHGSHCRNNVRTYERRENEQIAPLRIQCESSLRKLMYVSE